MKKEILNIDRDEELGLTEVSIRVPQFENFGKRLRILEEAWLGADSSDSGASRKGKVRVELKPSGKLSEIVEMVNKQFGVNLTTDDVEASWREDEEGDLEEEDEEEDPQRLLISLPEGVDWSVAVEERVDQFLADWPTLRPGLLSAVATYYDEIYADAVDFLGDEDGIEHILPKPGAPEIVADLFRFEPIQLRSDGSWVLGAECTWDAEHGLGAVVREGVVVQVGSCDVDDDELE